MRADDLHDRETKSNEAPHAAAVVGPGWIGVKGAF
jgi:hypothetical protein